MSPLNIRPFSRLDVGPLLGLMKDLARFEGYIDDFQVTKTDLIEKGLGDTPVFEAYVAEIGGCLCGMAVIYSIPWTYDLRPKIVLKELYVAKRHRGLGVGNSLIEAVRKRAVEKGASQVSWTVLKGNKRAEEFYTRLGGEPDPIWDGWVLNL